MRFLNGPSVMEPTNALNLETDPDQEFCPNFDPDPSPGPDPDPWLCCKKICNSNGRTFWSWNLCLKSCTYCLNLILYLQVWIRIRIRNMDPQSS